MPIGGARRNDDFASGRRGFASFQMASRSPLGLTYRWSFQAAKIAHDHVARISAIGSPREMAMGRPSAS
jgi:hypothetical protein